MRITIPSKPAPRHRGMPCQHCSTIVERTVYIADKKHYRQKTTEGDKTR